MREECAEKCAKSAFLSAFLMQSRFAARPRDCGKVRMRKCECQSEEKKGKEKQREAGRLFNVGQASSPCLGMRF
jgi:hypothetical protein